MTASSFLLPHFAGFGWTNFRSFLLSLTSKLCWFGNHLPPPSYLSQMGITLLDNTRLWRIELLIFGDLSFLHMTLSWLGTFYMILYLPMWRDVKYMLCLFVFYVTVSQSSLCIYLLHFPLAQRIWRWLAIELGTSFSTFGSLLDFWVSYCRKPFSPQLYNLWLAVGMHTLMEIWKARNRLRFENRSPMFSIMCYPIMAWVQQISFFCSWLI